MFFWNSLAFSKIQLMLEIWNLIPLHFCKSSLYIWKFEFNTAKPSLKDFEHKLASMWNECNCVVVWTFFGIAFLWDWNENGPFPVLWPLLSFPNLLAYWVQHLHSIIFQDFSSDGQRSLVCCSPWGRIQLDTTEWLKCTEVNSAYKLSRLTICNLDILFSQFGTSLLFHVQF